MTKARQQLPGSERAAVKGSKCLGPIEPNATLHVVVALRRRAERELAQFAQSVAHGQQSEPLSREAFAQRFGVAPEDFAKLEAFAREYQLRVERRDLSAAKVVLSGTAEHFQAAFGVELSHYEHPTLGRFRGRTGSITIPAEIADVVTAVLGLDNRPQARPHFRLSTGRPGGPIQARDASQTFTPVQLAGLYDFPDGDGAGQCIGLIELGGGYEASDLSTYFSSLGVPAPEVVSVPVDGTDNSPTGDPGGPDGEVTLDIEIAGAIAPKAKIAAYFAPNSDAGFVDAVSQALHDSTNSPTVLSISWGAPESSWTDQAVASLNDALQSAVALGVTICAAAGDSGSSDGASDGADHVDFPASSPYVLACGGTHVTASTASATIASEVVWNDGAGGGATGGGVSARFALPAWQEGLSAARVDGSAAALAMRGVPDVAADASPASGYQVLVDGQSMPVGGTSAVAPLFAGLVARINALSGKAVGFVNPKLYQSSAAFNDITSGDNGTYAAAAGWDACTGLGSPKGRGIAAALGVSAASSPGN